MSGSQTALPETMLRGCLVVDGAIGVGKTELARALTPHVGAVLLSEEQLDIPFLDEFYRARARWSLTCQLAFLEARVRQLGRADLLGMPVVADHSLEKDQLFAALNVQGAELALYQRLFERLAITVRLKVQVVIYLKASVPTLLSRLRNRARKSDQRIDDAYLAQVAQAYDALYLQGNGQRRVVVVDLDRADLRQDPEGCAQLLRVALQAPLGVTYYNPEV